MKRGYDLTRTGGISFNSRRARPKLPYIKAISLDENIVARVKLYSLPEESYRFSDEFISITKNEISGMFISTPRVIEPRYGIGFAIIAPSRGANGSSVPGRLNVVMYGKEDPSVLYPSVFYFNQDKFEGFVPQEISKVGAFDTFEIGIVQHEAEAWRRLLLSGSLDSKSLEKYLLNQKSGLVSSKADLHPYKGQE